MGTVPTPLKWHGGKHYLAARIIGLMPPHTHYVEPYAGGLSVLLAKEPEGVSEVINDIDGTLTNFWQVLKDPELFQRFQRIAEATPFSEVEWGDALTLLDHPDPVRRAVAFFVRARQSLAGRGACFAPLSRARTRRGMNEQASAWLTAVEGLPAVHARLKRVAILNRSALDAIRHQDSPDALLYCDPPYATFTRTAPDVYAYEMSGQDHVDLLKALRTVKGKFLLSGYDNVVYARAASLWGWKCHRFEIANHAAGGTKKRRMEECVWSNFP